MQDDRQDERPGEQARKATVGNSDTVRQQTRLWAGKARSLLYDWLTRFGNACSRNWTVLDRTGRILVACLGVLSLCCTLLAIAGWSRKPAPDAETQRRIAEAAERQAAAAERAAVASERQAAETAQGVTDAENAEIHRRMYQH